MNYCKLVLITLLSSAYTTFLFCAQSKIISKQNVATIQKNRSNQSTDSDYEEEKNKNSVKALVEKAQDYMRKNSLTKSLSAFSHAKEFLYGNHYVFVIETNGICVAIGSQQEGGQIQSNNSMIWQNILNLRSELGIPIVKRFIDVAHNGGGWVTYRWRNATIDTYVIEVEKDGKNYVIGAGYFPFSKMQVTRNLVKGAVVYFNELKDNKKPPEEAFAVFNYSEGRFVWGDLYLYLLDFEGNILVKSEHPKQAGTNDWSFSGEKNIRKLYDQQIIAKLEQNPGQGLWTTYTEENAERRAYIEEIQDYTGKKYFIGCGYYPAINKQSVLDMIEKGKKHIQEKDIKEAFNDITNDRERFNYGGLYLIIYDFEGNCVAHGHNSAKVGQNFFNERDNNGILYVQKIIEKAQKSDGWLEFKIRNAFEQMYITKVLDKYVMVCGFFPVSREQSARSLVNSASFYFNQNTMPQCLKAFADGKGKFILGDLSVLLMDDKGLCYVWGDTSHLKLKNIMNEKDDSGKEYIKEFVRVAQDTVQEVSYNLNGAHQIALVKKVTKQGRNFILASSFVRGKGEK